MDRLDRQKMALILKSKATRRAKRTGSSKEQAKVMYRQMHELDKHSKDRGKYQKLEHY
jgi:ribosomal protein S15P/S13E